MNDNNKTDNDPSYTEEILKAHLDDEGYKRISRLENPSVNRFIAKYVELCNPEKVFVSKGSPEDIKYINGLLVSK